MNHFATRPKDVLLFTQLTFEGGDIEIVRMVQEMGVASGEIEEIDFDDDEPEVEPLSLKM